MNQSLSVPARHTDRILDVVQRGVRADEISEVVASSWMRCLQDYRLHPDRAPRPPSCPVDELDERRERMADVIECARYEMTTLFQQLADPLSAVVLTDTDGVILHMVSSPEFADELKPVGFHVGAKWSEAEAGTNGMGTCLAAARPISVRQEDHFFTRFTSLTCSAVPIIDPSGRMAAVLDVTSRSNLMQQHVLVLLDMTARMIENRLLDRRFRHAHPVHFHTRPEFVYTLHEGRLALGQDGRILAANRSALFQLGVRSLAELNERRIDDFFETTLDDIVERSSAASFHPVVTYRVNGAHRFFAVARRPAGDGAAAALPRRLAAARPLRPSAHAPTSGDPILAAHLETARRVIARNTPVLLHGETGAGKEVFARAVHERSGHAGGAFVAVNCASLPESLIEAELFGYRAGAFTGAQRSGRRGKILQADGGTLFLDEIGDMPLDLQARLLRVLDERQVTPLGTEETHAVNFQLLSASHRKLAELVAEGRFREDLYYRLNGIELHLPPLRERADRRELIAKILREEAGGEAPGLTPEAEALLMAHPWPGNLRQMRHVLRTAVALSDGEPIGLPQLPSLAGGSPAAAPSQPAPGTFATPQLPAPEAAPSIPESLPEPAPSGLNVIQSNERQVLLRLLEQHRWNVSNVAKALDVSRNTLYRKLHKLQIPVTPRA
ncbi:sigma-54-dependent Fis family transcriptional regulator [Caldimonas tepidiphila]|uniref:sigma-54-dependent Fis family transcriptional regulator n=1 Tax=Caldimonas tepidiphila TaxID=2315841 RepID=UPI000E5A5A70|nr:sigma-54-dependent Fis family transcriptional regulator [Caldimonas tepidiphila]